MKQGDTQTEYSPAAVKKIMHMRYFFLFILKNRHIFYILLL